MYSSADTGAAYTQDADEVCSPTGPDATDTPGAGEMYSLTGAGAASTAGAGAVYSTGAYVLKHGPGAR